MLHLPDAHHGLRTSTGQPGAVGTPVHVEEGGDVALKDAQRLATLHVPQPQGAIVTATEQAAAVRREGQARSLRQYAHAASPGSGSARHPTARSCVTATTGQEPPIRTPRDATSPGGYALPASGARLRFPPPTA